MLLLMNEEARGIEVNERENWIPSYADTKNVISIYSRRAIVEGGGTCSTWTRVRRNSKKGNSLHRFIGMLDARQVIIPEHDGVLFRSRRLAKIVRLRKSSSK